MKAILISINPKHVANILNGEKTIEIRKKFPKDYVGWVYIYVTKGKPYITGIYNYEHKVVYGDIENKNHNINGKVVARFWCDKVEEIYNDSDEHYECYYQTDTLAMEDLCEQSCLDYNELNDYLCEEQGKAIHITSLEIFDKPKEISEFYKLGFEKEYNQAVFCLKNNVRWKTEPYYVIEDYQLTRAPQSWCYVEVGK